MDESTDKTPGTDPKDESGQDESAHRGVFSSDPGESVMPETGVFPVVAPERLRALQQGIPPSDFPTTQHDAAKHSADLPELGDHAGDVHRHISGPSHPPVPPQGSVWPQHPGGPGFPGGPFAPAYQPPAYAGSPRRHPWEIPLLVIVILVTLGVYVGSLLLAVFGVINSYLLLLLTVPIILWFGRGVTWATPRVSGIQMTPTQFPEGYAMVREAAARYGLREVPDAFVVLGNGQINAFASGHGFRRFVVIYSDLFEVGGAARDPEALRYIIGHEVGHIAAGHVSYWRQVGSFAMQYIPIVGSALSRSQEYTADNYGYFNQPSGVIGGMGLLGAGKYLGKEVDFDQLADRASTDRGFFTWVVNLLASHPVLTWRAAALRNRTKAGSLFFAPGQTVRGIGGGAVIPSGPVPTFTEQEVLAQSPGSQSAGHQPFPPGR